MTSNESAKKGITKDPEKINTYDTGRTSLDSPFIIEGEDVLGRQDLDPALNAKMHLVKNVRWIPKAPIQSYLPMRFLN